ncbi:MFS transporter [Bacillus taeanensis]|uniref:MFS transporter n=2 Tax=Bacillus taeanensis TaxID=273032 RepID=A0A366XUZ8_9BACI|nr:MFS transporter [Bacillus taeanensis]
MVNLFIVMTGIGLVVPILPYYVQSFDADGKVLGMLIASYAFMQFLFAPLWGRLSDKYGRKPMVAVGMFGFAIAEFIFASASGIWMLFLSRMLAGIFGSALLPTAMAYIADITPNEKRGQGMGIMGAAMGLGFVIGPALGGWLAEYSLSLPFFTAGCAGLLGGLVALFALKESLLKEHRIHLDERENQFIQIARALKSPVGFLLILVLILSFGLANFQSIFGFYALRKFGYSPSQVGVIITIVGLVGTAAQGALVGRLTSKFGEERVVTGALLLSAFGFIIMTLAFDFITILLTTCTFFLGNSLLRPSVNALISKLAGNRQGMIMGLNNSFMSLGNVIGPLAAGALFEVNIHIPYLLGAFVMVIGFIATKRWISKHPKKEVVQF